MPKAIVLGGGFSGMLAAKVLSNYYEQIILIERFDDFVQKNNGSIRKGIPQAHHLHVLLKHGQDILSKLFPEVINQLASLSPTIDWGSDTKWYNSLGVYPQSESGIKTMSFSRLLLDQLMIKEISNISNITIQIGEVNEFEFDQCKQSILGVKLNDNMIYADFIIDARGRRSTINKVLNQVGFKTPVKTKVENLFGYASRRYQANFPRNHQIYLQVDATGFQSGAVMVPIENNQFIVTLIGIAECRPDKGGQVFSDFLASLNNVDVNRYLNDSTPISNVYLYRDLGNIHFHYGSMKHWPKNLIVIGDAAYVLNPVYGQGMTLAAMQVNLLNEQLKKSQFFAQNFQKNIDAIVKVPWMLATVKDRAFNYQYSSSINDRLARWYFNAILKMAIIDKNIHRYFLRILHMNYKPYELFHPIVFIKTIINSFFGAFHALFTSISCHLGSTKP